MVSIVVPIYNVEKYLEPCIESILNSTFKDFELLLVDDGSTDTSGSICDHLAEQDTRIRVIHQENGGVASARNHGLELAKGEYVMFIDGDDIIHCRMIEILYQAINIDNCDLALAYITNAQNASIENLIQKTENELEKLKVQVISQTEYISRVFSINAQYISVCNKLFKKSLIQDLCFNHYKIAEDLEWQTRICLRMKKAALAEAHMYYYIQREGSAMHSGFDSIIKSFDVYLLCLGHIPKENKRYRAIVLKGIYTYMLQVRRYCYKSEDYNKCKASCDKVFKETRKEFLHSDVSLFSKLRSLFGYYCPGPYNFILNRMESRVLRKSS